jgi:hypothetical protein
VFACSAVISAGALLFLAVVAVAALSPDRTMISPDLLVRLDEVRRAFADKAGERGVLFVGDSILGAGEGMTVARSVERSLGERSQKYRFAAEVLWWPGLLIMNEYCIADDLADLGADRIVLEVNLHSLSAAAAVRYSYPELAGHIHAARFMEALDLPLDIAGITENRLLFYRLLVASGLEAPWAQSIDSQARIFNLRERAERAMERKLGVFTLDARALALWDYGVAHFHVPGRARERIESVLGARWTMRTGATTSYPPLRILGAVVRRFASAGRRPLVWIAPVNVDHLMSIGIDVSGFDRSAAAIRSVVEENGGTSLDLHAALRDAEFLDAGDHATSRGERPGTEIIANHIVAALLSSESP